jgi:hypothetical protein
MSKAKPINLAALDPVTLLLERMTEVERIKIYQAEPDRLEYLRQTTMGYGPISTEMMQDLKTRITERMVAYDPTLKMVPSTWKW